MSETDCTDCGEILREIEAYIDHELDAGRQVEIQEHLDACSPCLDRAEFRAKLREIVSARCCSEDVPTELADRIRLLLAQR